MRRRYLQALRCKSPEVIPHQVWLNHPEFISDCTGIDYYDKPGSASKRFHEIWDIDNGGPMYLDDTPRERPKAEKKIDGGVTTDEGFNTVWHTDNPFSGPEDMWNFDPDPNGKDADKALEPQFAIKSFKWCFEPDSWNERRQTENANWAKLEAVFPGKFTDARSFYCTCFMWGICLFGWDIFLLALGMDPDKTGQALERISEVTVKMYEYFATCENAEFICPHDDVCISSGPVVSPDWYRQYIWPQYEKIFAPVKQAGKPVIITADGDLSKLAPDMAKVVDGFIFESSTPADFMFDNFGENKCLIGGIDVRVLTFGTADEVEKHVKDIIAKGRNCPGYVIACADTIPSNVPIKNVYTYFKTVEKERKR